MNERTADGRAEVAATVHEVVAAILPAWHGTDLPGDRHLKELGADSVDRVEIIVTLLERYGLDRPMAEFGEIPDVDHLVDHLAGLLAARAGTGVRP